ncbi:MAG: hypothetical protein ACD_67C00034G0003 [uncultured bacterium]|nr:MAG: hypothetical protein ACD_67C00034G0003 [uncultured bacterium]
MDGFSKYHFKDLGESEEIVKVLHRNWFYLLQQFLVVFAVAGVFAVGLFYAPKFFPELSGRELKSIAAFMENFFMLALWIYSFLIWVDYYFDIWIITTERIVNVEQKGMFSREVSELRYNKIEDITTEVVGFLPTVINFGDVRIQTAAENTEFRFRTVSDPYHVKSIIMELQKKAEVKKTENFGEMLRDKISGE